MAASVAVGGAPVYSPRIRFALRTTIVVAGLGLAIVTLRFGLALRLSQTAPSMAAELAPYDARIAMNAARAAVAGGAKLDDPHVRGFVDKALARDATLTSAIEYRALEAQLANDRPRAARLFALSAAISRRSLPTRLWLIQRAVERGDVERALNDFDVALRTSTAAPKVLFPILARAAADPTLVKPIAHILDRPEQWRIKFLYYAVTERHAPDGIGDVVLNMRNRRAITGAKLDQALVGELVARRNFSLARQVYDAFHPSLAPVTAVRDGDFSHPGMAFPFGWQLMERGDAGAQRGEVAGRPALVYEAESGGEGVVAAQLLTLPPGDYRISATTASAASDGAASPYWTLTCGGAGGAQIALLDQPKAAATNASGDFAVPPDCTAQWLALTLRLSDVPSSSGAIASISVARR